MGSFTFSVLCSFHMHESIAVLSREKVVNTAGIKENELESLDRAMIIV